MLHTLSIWLLVAGFFGAGLFNAIGAPTTKASFASWGYPEWWCRLTGGLEIASAILIAIPGCQRAGLILGFAIVAAAVLTVLRYRGFSHLMPLGVFVTVLVLAEISA